MAVDIHVYRASLLPRKSTYPWQNPDIVTDTTRPAMMSTSCQSVSCTYPSPHVEGSCTHPTYMMSSLYRLKEEGRKV